MIVFVVVLVIIMVWFIILSMRGQEVIEELNKKYPNAVKFTFYCVKGPKSFAISHFKRKYPNTFNEDRLILTGGGWKYLLLKEEVDNG